MVGVHFYTAQQHWSIHHTVGVVIFYEIAPPVHYFLRKSIGADRHIDEAARAATPRAEGWFVFPHATAECATPRLFHPWGALFICIDRSR